MKGDGRALWDVKSLPFTIQLFTMPTRPNLTVRSSIVFSIAAIAALGFTSRRAPAPARVQLDMATLHAAALSKARTARDSADAPYLMVTMFGPGTTHTSMQMPSANTHWGIRLNEAKGASPLTTIDILPGDSVTVLFTLLEADEVNNSGEKTVGTALTQLKLPSVPLIAPTLAPLITRGTHWIGSATMLLTNEGGKTYWRALDCVSTCTVSNSPVKSSAESELAPNAANALAGVLELTGNSSTYHLAVTARRAS